MKPLPRLSGAGASLILASLLTLPLLAQGNIDEGERPRSPRSPRASFQPIPKPADPAKVRGTFTLNGEQREITEGVFHATYLRLKPHLETEGRALQAQQVLEHILLYAEAEALMLAPTEAELALLNPASGAMRAQMLERWEAAGIQEEEALTFIRERTAIERLRDWFANTITVPSKTVFDRWKEENLLYSVDYVAFDTAGQAAEIAARTPTDEQLQQFWSRNPVVQRPYMRPSTVTGDLLVFDASGVSEEELERLRAGRSITRSDALAHFSANRARLMEQIPSDKRLLLYPAPSEKVALEELVTPFQLLTEVIERELILGNRLDDAHKALMALEGREDVDQIAERFGVEHRAVDTTQLLAFTRNHGDLGADLFQRLHRANPGQVCEQIVTTGPISFIWRLDDKVIASLPPFEEVKGELVADWRKQQASEAARKAAQTLLDGMSARVDEIFAERFAEIDAEAKKRADEAIKGNGITDERSKQAYHQREKARAEQEKRTIRSSEGGKYADEVLASLQQSWSQEGPFSFSFVNWNGLDDGEQRSELAPEKARAAFFRSAFQLRGMQPGMVVPTVMTDPETNTHYVVRLAKTEEPSPESMPATQFYQRRIALERQTMYMVTYQWSGFSAQQRLGWKENS